MTSVFTCEACYLYFPFKIPPESRTIGYKATCPICGIELSRRFIADTYYMARCDREFGLICIDTSIIHEILGI